MMSWFTPKRIIIGVIAIGGTLVLIGLITSWTSSRYEAKMDEQRAIAAAAEARAEEHRKRAAELEAQMAARDQAIQAKDILIESNSRRAEEVNEQINDEQKRYLEDVAVSESADPELLRQRICARLAAARIAAPTYCSGQGTR